MDYDENLDLRRNYYALLACILNPRLTIAKSIDYFLYDEPIFRNGLDRKDPRSPSDDDQRKFVYFRDVKELTFAEIGKRLGFGCTTVSNYYYKLKRGGA